MILDTKTSCIFSHDHCILQDGTIIVWKSSNTTHDFSDFLKIPGSYEIRQINQFYLIPALKIGGHAQIHDGKSKRVVLTSGYVIERQGAVLQDKGKQFFKKVKDYVEKLGQNSIDC